MSSHHIVRDEQEPALILANKQFHDFSHVSQMLEWSPVVLTLPDALAHALSWQIKIDIALVNNLPEDQKRLSHQKPIQITEANPNTLSQAIQLLHSKGHQAINVFTEEFAFAQSEEILKEWAMKLDLVIFCPNWKFVFLRDGKFQKWWGKGTKLKLPPHSQSQPALSIENNLAKTPQSGLFTIGSQPQEWLGEFLG